MAKSIFEHRLIAALVLCMSGLALLPFNPLPSQVFSWERLAGAYEVIFGDNFESGTTDGWEYFAPENLRLFPSSNSAAFVSEFHLDRELISRYDEDGVLLLAGFTRNGGPVFLIEGRATRGMLEVRSRAALDDGSWRVSDWLELGRNARLGVEWQRGHSQAQDGILYLSINGELRTWLTELDNDTLSLDMTGVAKSGARTFLDPR